MRISISFQKNHHKNSYRALNTFSFVVGTAGWEDFVESRDGSWSDPGSFQMPRGKKTQCSPHLAKTKMKTWTTNILRIMNFMNLNLPLFLGEGAFQCIPLAMYYTCVSILLSLSLSLSLYIYNGFLPHFPFTACTCSYFCNKHTVDEVYCNEIHLICKDTSTYAKESRGQKFSPQQEPLVWKWIQKKGLYSAVLNPANSPSPSDLGRVDPFGGVVPPGPMAVA